MTRDANAFETTRKFRIEACATGVATISTPANRELYVERLISQNRNSVLSITSPAIDRPGHATVLVGRTYTFTVTAKTATSGTITVRLPDGLTYTGASGTGWVCNAVGQVVTCSHAGPLGADESSVVTIDVSVDPTGPSTITNEVVVSYPDDDDPSNNSASGTGTVDRAPHTSGDTATTGENSPVTIEVTDNDSGGDGTLTVTGHTDPPNGAVTCTASECTYTPDTGYSGSDTFDYTLTDADGDAATGTVTVTVTPAPPLPTTTTTVAPRRPRSGPRRPPRRPPRHRQRRRRLPRRRRRRRRRPRRSMRSRPPATPAHSPRS